MPEERYFSMPSTEVGAEVRRKRALNCWPWVRSLIHAPVAVIHSPAAMVAAWPTTVTSSTRPASTSVADSSGAGFMRIGAVGEDYVDIIGGAGSIPAAPTTQVI